jgi:alpha-glucosidase
VNSSVVINPGTLLDFTISGNKIEGRATNAWFRIDIFNDAVANIRFSRTADFSNQSYSVVQSSSNSKFIHVATDLKIRITTPKFTICIDKKTCEIRFMNASGAVLNEDEAGLSTSWIGDQVTTYKKLQPDERFIGLGEKTGPLDRKGKGYQHWNTDAFAYGPDSDPIYCSIPFYIGIHEAGSYGIFFDNSYKTFFNFGASNNRFASFSADAGEMNYYFIGGDTVAEIIQNYTWLTGRMEMPPLWSLGYQQCRYSYYPDKEVSTLAKTFRDKKISADAIVLDIHYMDMYKIFSWHPEHFSDPDALLAELKSLGFEVVLMCDPGIKAEKGYGPYDEGAKQDLFLKYPDGENYTGQVWPGWCHFPDFTKPETRAWWQKWLKTYSDKGVSGYWNDMNEIATWGQMLPENIVFDFDGNPTTSREGRNLYGMMMARATYEGAKENLKGKRPFNLTRSGFSGIQRYAAVWTGDNVSYDEHMMLGVRLVNSMGLSGIAFAGYDVGGFVGEASAKLFARWISIGALSPFFRGHTMINSRDSEPWAFGEDTEMISRNYIRLRYQLMPYIYSCFYEASRTGMPVQRSLAIQYTQEPKIYQHTYQHQYLFGPYILVAPVESDKDLVKVFLPEGTWRYLFNGKVFEGNQEIVVDCPVHKLPVFIKSSAIIPMQQPAENTKAKQDILYLHIYQGTENSSFEYYSDDGETFDYQSGKHSLRKISYQASVKKITIGTPEGSYTSAIKNIKLMLHGFSGISAKVNSKPVTFTSEKLELFLPMEKFDPLYDPDSMGCEDVLTLEFPNLKEEIIIDL